MHFVYILYSDRINQFYVGETTDVNERLIKHNEERNESSTAKGRPWVLKAYFEVPDRSYALRVEKFIKRQKSRMFIEKLIEQGHLKKFPEMKQVSL